MIRAAAILVNGRVYEVPQPQRHHDCIALYLERNAGESCIPAKHIQGFVTTTGQFVDRRQAVAIAKRANQIKIKTGPPDQLFSEDLW